MNNYRKKFRNIKRLVVKVGTSTVTHPNGKMNLRCIDKLGMVLSDVINQGIEVILVTSGAIGVGVGKLNLNNRPTSIGGKQAAAAIGQCVLMNIYSKFFSDYGKTVGQILLTKDIIEDQERKRNVVNTFDNLLKHGIIPIVNENDSVATDELEYGEKKLFGDNDTMSAIVASVVNADLLVILSDVDGFYSGDPKKDSSCKKLDYIYHVNDEIKAYAGGRGSKQGTGGMITKLSAAQLVMEEGIDMVLSSGDNPLVIYDILDGKDIGTVFIGRSNNKTEDCNE